MNIPKIQKNILEFLNTAPSVRWILLALVLAVFTVVLYPNLLAKKYEYQLGDVAKEDIKAPRDFLIEDRTATENKQQEEAGKILTLYDHNTTLSDSIREHVDAAFGMMQAFFQEDTLPAAEDHMTEGRSRAVGLSERILGKKEEFEKKLGIPVSNSAFKLLEKEKFSREIADFINQIIDKILENGVVSTKEIFLRESDRGIILRTVDTKEEQKVFNLKQFYGLDQAKMMVRVIAQPMIKDLNYAMINLIVDFCQQLIQPNITLNRSETEARKQNAAEAVKPIFYKIKAGEMLLREGERVTEVQLLKLKTLRQQNRQESQYLRIAGMLMVIMILLIVIFFLHTTRRGYRIFKTNKEMLFIAVILIVFFFLPDASRILFASLTQNTLLSVSESAVFFGVPLAAGTMTVCLFMGFEVAVCFAVIISVCTAFIFQNRLEVFLYFFPSSLMAVHWVRNCRERKVFIKSGFQIGLLNIALATAISAFMGDMPGLDILGIWVLAFMGGMAAGIIAAGIVPLLEMSFNYTTDITLLELANLERPILRELMMQAPGTYHHSVLVGSMVEAAAAEIGANPLLAKVCGYYHDIGKIKKPLYFIENQSRENRHDKLAPSMSSLILISHVKEGVEIAKKHKLGPDIIDAIRQHHGTSLIKYFYEKARKLKGDDAVKIEDFRYPGPRPQTREIALVMLADVVEAASRTLENPTPARIQGLVQSLINKIFSDEQLDNCQLTLNDLNNIAKCFNKILNGIHHHRIEYPEKTAKNEKDKNGSSDQQPAAPGKDIPKKDSEEDGHHLKRLGVS
jgi:hypothetical protein